MNEQELRAIVREAVAKQLGASHESGHGARPLVFTSHASHFRYSLPESDGPCLIEPSVQCNRCGYCESHGH